jgi:hypothetical protein
VTLLERERSLGGTATSALVGTLCGLYRNGGEIPGEPLHGGITAEIVAALTTSAPQRGLRKSGRVFVLPFESAELRSILEQLCAAATLLTVHYTAAPVAATVADGMVSTVTATIDGSSVMFSPKAVIDASGSAAVATLAGARCELSGAGERQLAGFTAKVAGLQDVTESLSLRVPFVIARGIEAGAIPASLRYTVFAGGERAGEGLLKVSIPDEAHRDGARLAADVAALVTVLGAELPEFSRAFVVATSGRSYSREGARIIGSYQLTAADVLAGRKFVDGVVKGAWPMEIWSSGRGVSYRYPPDNDYYEIPAGCLQAQGFSNLFMAGRCISVTPEALGSTRVIATCLALGEAAGLAATTLILPS